MANLALIRTPNTNQHPRENQLATASLAALNAEFFVDCDGCSSFALDLRGTFNLAIQVSGTVDGETWTTIPMLPVNQASRAYVVTIAGAVAGVWEGKCSPYWRLKVSCTAYTSGAAIVAVSASNGIFDDLSRRITSNSGTILGTVSTATTLTLASPGVGLRHYLTSIKIDRFATAALTAAATPIAITTTNIPGTLAFSFAAEGAAIGSLVSAQMHYDYPLMAAAQNTATTIVAPATTNAIWRITAGYFVAP